MPRTEVPTPAAPRPVVLVVDDMDAVRNVVRAGLGHHGFASVASPGPYKEDRR